MAKITEIYAREILDSRGNPTVNCIVELDDGFIGEASVPSGASTGVHEALELRDEDKKRFQGKGVLKAVENVNTKIKDALAGHELEKISEIDKLMLDLDGTENKKNLGANAVLSVSLACARAAASSKGMELYEFIRDNYDLNLRGYSLPIATMNIINGGKHADNTISSQEFMIVPVADTIRERVRIGSEVFHSLKKVLADRGNVTTVGDEGGFAPNEDEDENGLKLIVEGIKKAGYQPGQDVNIAMDVAASEFFEEGGGYDFDFKKESKGKNIKSSDETLKMYKSWLEKYPIVSIEDPFDEDAWEDWKKFTREVGDKVSVVGDDLFVTNSKRLQKGIDMKVGNAILIKLNQIGTLTETIEAIMLAKKNGYKTSISHRSGETCDTFIADLAVAVNSEFIKTGSMSRSERVGKYNRLMKIEQLIK